MKNLQIIKMLGISALILAISSCSLDPVIHSEVTNYPIMSLKGSATIFVPLGGTYNDPGINATENGAPIAYTSTGAGKYRNGKTLDLNVGQDELLVACYCHDMFSKIDRERHHIKA